MKKLILGIFIGLMLGLMLSIQGSEIQHGDLGDYYQFEVLLPPAYIDYFLQFEQVDSIVELEGDHGEQVSRVYLDIEPHQIRAFEKQLRSANYLLVQNKHSSTQFSLDQIMTNCYWDYGLDKTIGIYFENKQLKIIEDDPRCNFQ